VISVALYPFTEHGNGQPIATRRLFPTNTQNLNFSSDKWQPILYPTAISTQKALFDDFRVQTLQHGFLCGAGRNKRHHKTAT
jgi:hypothetical protein